MLASAFFAFVTFLLLGTEISPSSARLTWWATFLGVSSTFLAAFQYLPQIMHTYQHKLVGALSIPMMLIQTPGAILMVTSIAIRYASLPPCYQHVSLICLDHSGRAPTGQVRISISVTEALELILC